MKILVAAAHPDDEVLGCGATAARLARQGHDVRIALFSGGAASRYAHGDAASAAGERERRQCALAAAADLGAGAPVFLDFPDNRFDTCPTLELAQAVEALLDDFPAEAVFTHHGGDLNVDHAALCRAVLTATRPMRGCPVRDVYCFEVPSSTEWSFGQAGRAFAPNVYYGAAETLDAKLAAMARYAAETRPFPHPRSPEALRALALRRGSEAGLPAAEAFELVRSLR